MFRLKSDAQDKLGWFISFQTNQASERPRFDSVVALPFYFLPLDCKVVALRLVFQQE